MRTFPIYSDEKNSEIRKNHPYLIWESLNAIPELLEICLEEEVREKVLDICDKLIEKKIDRLFLTGRGSSYFLATGLWYIFNELTSYTTHCMVSSNLTEYPPNDLDEKSAIFVISASGKSEGDLDVIALAKTRNAYTIAVTDVEHSPLAEAADDILLGPGGAKRELPATRSYATALFRMSLLAAELGDKKEKNVEECIQSLNRLPKYSRELMHAFEPQALKIAEQIKDIRAFYVLAFGPNYTNAEEFAMALNQSSGIPSIGYEMENFIHGPMQALTVDEGVFLLAPNGIPQERMLRLTQAIKTIGATTILLGPEEVRQMTEPSIFIEMSDEFPEVVTPLLYMLPLWQTAYALGQLKNFIHPDRLSMIKPEFVEGFKKLMSQDKWVK